MGPGSYLSCIVWGAQGRTSTPQIVRRGRATRSSRPSTPYRSPPRVAATPKPAASGGNYGQSSGNLDSLACSLINLIICPASYGGTFSQSYAN